MSALSVRGSLRVVEVSDGIVQFGFILTYSGSKFSPSTEKKLENQSA